MVSQHELKLNINKILGLIMNKQDDSAELILAIEENIKSKQLVKASVLEKIVQTREQICLQDENKVLEGKVLILKQKIDDLYKENSGCFKEYQETQEVFEEIYSRRKIYIEGVYKDLATQLEELTLRESLIDQKILQLEREKTVLGSDNLAILYTYTQKKLNSTSFFEYLLYIILICVSFYLILN